MSLAYSLRLPVSISNFKWQHIILNLKFTWNGKRFETICLRKMGMVTGICHQTSREIEVHRKSVQLEKSSNSRSEDSRDEWNAAYISWKTNQSTRAPTPCRTFNVKQQETYPSVTANSIKLHALTFTKALIRVWDGSTHVSSYQRRR